MAYLVNISDSDQAYLDGLPLSETANGRVDDFIDYAVANVDDSFRNDPANRPSPNSHFFQARKQCQRSFLSEKIPGTFSFPNLLGPGTRPAVGRREQVNSLSLKKPFAGSARRSDRY